MNFTNLLGICRIGRLSPVFLRNYAFKSDLKIKWNRPERVSCIKPEKSGDLSVSQKLPPATTLYELQGSKELESASDIVKQIFTIDHNRKQETKTIRRYNMIQDVHRHDLDYGSVEAKLADMTAKIRHLQEYMDKHPRNVRSKVFLKEMIDKRKRFLRYLRRWDYKKFEWILEKLDIVYKPYPSEFHWITRKESLQKLTDIHCDKIKNARLEAYRTELENQQVEFLENKIRNLQLIQDEQKELKLPVTVTEKDVAAAKQKLIEVLARKEIVNEALAKK